MATSEDFIEFVCEQIRGDYSVRYKKMFGEYMVYVNDNFHPGVQDGQTSCL